MRGLEPLRAAAHYVLSVACLPITAHRLVRVGRIELPSYRSKRHTLPLHYTLWSASGDLLFAPLQPLGQTRMADSVRFELTGLAPTSLAN